ncbi:MAG: hypothetical protein ACOX6U_05370 [Oscillospiraceae bacterium]|jgi:hypothetical protein
MDKLSKLPSTEKTKHQFGITGESSEKTLFETQLKRLAETFRQPF